jgi:serine/threonine-protein kinase OSR1/STK39
MPLPPRDSSSSSSNGGGGVKMRPSKSTGSFGRILSSLTHSGSSDAVAGSGASDADAAANDAKAWPTTRDAYKLLEPIGSGVSATVYLALCVPTGERVAVKALDLDALASPLEDVEREVAAMKGYRHPAILPLYTSFVSGATLHLVMPYMAGGSVAHILRYRCKDGLEEAVRFLLFV